MARVRAQVWLRKVTMAMVRAAGNTENTTVESGVGKALQAGKRVPEVKAENLGAEIADSSSSLVVIDPTGVVLGV